MGLIVQTLNLIFSLSSQLLLRNLSAQKLAVHPILLLSILLLDELHSIHVIDGRVELLLLFLTGLLDTDNLVLETSEG